MNHHNGTASHKPDISHCPPPSELWGVLVVMVTVLGELDHSYPAVNNEHVDVALVNILENFASDHNIFCRSISDFE